MRTLREMAGALLDVVRVVAFLLLVLGAIALGQWLLHLAAG